MRWAHDNAERPRAALVLFVGVGLMVVGGAVFALRPARSKVVLAPVDAPAPVHALSIAPRGIAAHRPSAAILTPLSIHDQAGPALQTHASQSSAKPVGAATPAAATPATGEICKGAIAHQKYTEVLASCPALFAARPSAATALGLAKAALEKGQAARAHIWASKALKLDAKAADAYIVLGDLAQEQHDATAARAAYQNYLRMAPNGRFAPELRAILKSL